MTREDKLQRFQEEYAKALWIIWSTQFLNQLRDSSPKVEGQLRKAMYAYRTANRLAIAFYPSGFYWHMIDGLPEKYQAHSQARDSENATHSL